MSAQSAASALRHRTADDYAKRAEQALGGYQHARDAFDAMGGRRGRSAVPREPAGEPRPARRDGADGRDDAGGKGNVLALDRALTRRPNLLVLDEPGNHLDFAGLAWLEKFLQEWDGAVLVVSHNRYLLDHVVDRIFELENRRLTAYDGNASQYRLERSRRLVVQQEDYVANQKRLSHLEALVARFAQIARAHPDPAWG